MDDKEKEGVIIDPESLSGCLNIAGEAVTYVNNAYLELKKTGNTELVNEIAEALNLEKTANIYLNKLKVEDIKKSIESFINDYNEGNLKAIEAVNQLLDDLEEGRVLTISGENGETYQVSKENFTPETMAMILSQYAFLNTPEDGDVSDMPLGNGESEQSALDSEGDGMAKTEDEPDTGISVDLEKGTVTLDGKSVTCWEDLTDAIYGSDNNRLKRYLYLVQGIDFDEDQYDEFAEILEKKTAKDKTLTSYELSIAFLESNLLFTDINGNIDGFIFGNNTLFQKKRTPEIVRRQNQACLDNVSNIDVLTAEALALSYLALEHHEYIEMFLNDKNDDYSIQTKYNVDFSLFNDSASYNLYDAAIADWLVNHDGDFLSLNISRNIYSIDYIEENSDAEDGLCYYSEVSLSTLYKEEPEIYEILSKGFWFFTEEEIELLADSGYCIGFHSDVMSNHDSSEYINFVTFEQHNEIYKKWYDEALNKRLLTKLTEENSWHALMSDFATDENGESFLTFLYSLSSDIWVNKDTKQFVTTEEANEVLQLFSEGKYTEAREKMSNFYYMVNGTDYEISCLDYIFQQGYTTSKIEEFSGIVDTSIEKHDFEYYSKLVLASTAQPLLYLVGGFIGFFENIFDGIVGGLGWLAYAPVDLIQKLFGDIESVQETYGAALKEIKKMEKEGWFSSQHTLEETIERLFGITFSDEFYQAMRASDPETLTQTEEYKTIANNYVTTLADVFDSYLGGISNHEERLDAYITEKIESGELTTSDLSILYELIPGEKKEFGITTNAFNQVSVTQETIDYIKENISSIEYNNDNLGMLYAIKMITDYQTTDKLEEAPKLGEYLSGLAYSEAFFEISLKYAEILEGNVANDETYLNKDDEESEYTERLYYIMALDIMNTHEKETMIRQSIEDNTFINKEESSVLETYGDGTIGYLRKVDEIVKDVVGFDLSGKITHIEALDKYGIFDGTMLEGVVTSWGEMIGLVLTLYLSGGTSLMGKTFSVLGQKVAITKEVVQAALIFQSAYGKTFESTYRDPRFEGASLHQRYFYSVISGVIEAKVESLGIGGSGLFGMEGMDAGINLTKELFALDKKSWVKCLFSFYEAKAYEGIEEIISGVLEPFNSFLVLHQDKCILKDDLGNFFIKGQFIEDFLSGYLAASLMNVSGITIHKAVEAKNGGNFRKDMMALYNPETSGMTALEWQQCVQSAETFIEKYMSGDSSAENLVLLMQANAEILKTKMDSLSEGSQNELAAALKTVNLGNITSVYNALSQETKNGLSLKDFSNMVVCKSDLIDTSKTLTELQSIEAYDEISGDTKSQIDSVLAKYLNKIVSDGGATAFKLFRDGAVIKNSDGTTTTVDISSLVESYDEWIGICSHMANMKKASKMKLNSNQEEELKNAFIEIILDSSSEKSLNDYYESFSEELKGKMSFGVFTSLVAHQQHKAGIRSEALEEVVEDAEETGEEVVGETEISDDTKDDSKEVAVDMSIVEILNSAKIEDLSAAVFGDLTTKINAIEVGGGVNTIPQELKDITVGLRRIITMEGVTDQYSSELETLTTAFSKVLEKINSNNLLETRDFNGIKINMIGTNASTLEIEYQKITEALERLPAHLKRYVTTVNIYDNNSTQDLYLMVTYNHGKSNFKSTASYQAGELSFYKPGLEGSSDAVYSIIEREIGHAIDQNNRTVNQALFGNAEISQSEIWKMAQEADLKATKKSSVTNYGAYNAYEDFAESVKLYLENSRDFARRFPNRAKVIQDVMKSLEILEANAYDLESSIPTIIESVSNQKIKDNLLSPSIDSIEVISETPVEETSGKTEEITTDEVDETIEKFESEEVSETEGEIEVVEVAETEGESFDETIIQIDSVIIEMLSNIKNSSDLNSDILNEIAQKLQEIRVGKDVHQPTEELKNIISAFRRIIDMPDAINQHNEELLKIAVTLCDTLDSINNNNLYKTVEFNGIKINLIGTNIDILEDKYQKIMSVLKTVPLHLILSLKEISVYDCPSAYNLVSSIKHNQADFVASGSYIASEQKISFYNNSFSDYSLKDISSTLYHELGHLIDGLVARFDLNFCSNGVLWKHAVEADSKIFKNKKAVSDYGKTFVSEDFAESVMMYLNNSKLFSLRFPNRAKVIHDMLFILEKCQSNTGDISLESSLELIEIIDSLKTPELKKMIKESFEKEYDCKDIKFYGNKVIIYLNNGGTFTFDRSLRNWWYLVFESNKLFTDGYNANCIGNKLHIVSKGVNYIIGNIDGDAVTLFSKFSDIKESLIGNEKELYLIKSIDLSSSDKVIITFKNDTVLQFEGILTSDILATAIEQVKSTTSIDTTIQIDSTIIEILESKGIEIIGASDLDSEKINSILGSEILDKYDFSEVESIEIIDSERFSINLFGGEVYVRPFKLTTESLINAMDEIFPNLGGVDRTTIVIDASILDILNGINRTRDLSTSILEELANKIKKIRVGLDVHSTTSELNDIIRKLEDIIALPKAIELYSEELKIITNQIANILTIINENNLYKTIELDRLRINLFGTDIELLEKGYQRVLEKFNSLPLGLRLLIRELNIYDTNDPGDLSASIEYNMPYFVASASCVGFAGTMSFFPPGYDCDGDSVLSTIFHELGHAIDEKFHGVNDLAFSSRVISDSQLWTDAVADDFELTGKKAVSDYGKTFASEDFAESVKMYLNNPEAFASIFPNRARVIHDALIIVESLSVRIAEMKTDNTFGFYMGIYNQLEIPEIKNAIINQWKNNLECENIIIDGNNATLQFENNITFTFDFNHLESTKINDFMRTIVDKFGKDLEISYFEGNLQIISKGIKFDLGESYPNINDSIAKIISDILSLSEAELNLIDLIDISEITEPLIIAFKNGNVVKVKNITIEKIQAATEVYGKKVDTYDIEVEPDGLLSIENLTDITIIERGSVKSDGDVEKTDAEISEDAVSEVEKTTADDTGKKVKGVIASTLNKIPFFNNLLNNHNRIFFDGIVGLIKTGILFAGLNLFPGFTAKIAGSYTAVGVIIGGSWYIIKNTTSFAINKIKMTIIERGSVKSDGDVEKTDAEISEDAVSEVEKTTADDTGKKVKGVIASTLNKIPFFNNLLNNHNRIFFDGIVGLIKTGILFAGLNLLPGFTAKIAGSYTAVGVIINGSLYIIKNTTSFAINKIKSSLSSFINRINIFGKFKAKHPHIYNILIKGSIKTAMVFTLFNFVLSPIAFNVINDILGAFSSLIDSSIITDALNNITTIATVAYASIHTISHVWDVVLSKINSKISNNNLFKIVKTLLKYSIIYSSVFAVLNFFVAPDLINGIVKLIANMPFISDTMISEVFTSNGITPYNVSLAMTGILAALNLITSLPKIAIKVVSTIFKTLGSLFEKIFNSISGEKIVQKHPIIFGVINAFITSSVVFAGIALLTPMSINTAFSASVITMIIKTSIAIRKNFINKKMNKAIKTVTEIVEKTDAEISEDAVSEVEKTTADDTGKKVKGVIASTLNKIPFFNNLLNNHNRIFFDGIVGLIKTGILFAGLNLLPGSTAKIAGSYTAVGVIIGGSWYIIKNITSFAINKIKSSLSSFINRINIFGKFKAKHPHIYNILIKGSIKTAMFFTLFNFVLSPIAFNGIKAFLGALSSFIDSSIITDALNDITTIATVAYASIHTISHVWDVVLSKINSKISNKNLSKIVKTLLKYSIIYSSVFAVLYFFVAPDLINDIVKLIDVSIPLRLYSSLAMTGTLATFHFITSLPKIAIKVSKAPGSLFEKIFNSMLGENIVQKHPIIFGVINAFITSSIVFAGIALLTPMSINTAFSASVITMIIKTPIAIRKNFINKKMNKAIKTVTDDTSLSRSSGAKSSISDYRMPTEVKEAVKSAKNTSIEYKIFGVKIKRYVANDKLRKAFLTFLAATLTVGTFVVVIDEKPKEEKMYLLLKGQNKITLFIDNEYLEPGYVAYDPIDGDITDKVIVKGNIDTSKLGIYLLTYTVTNSRDETISKTRIINVVNKTLVNEEGGDNEEPEEQEEPDDIVIIEEEKVWEENPEDPVDPTDPVEPENPTYSYVMTEIKLNDFNEQIEKSKIYNGIKQKPSVLLKQYIDKFMLQNRLIYAISLTSNVKYDNKYKDVYACNKNYNDTEASAIIVTNGTLERVYNSDNNCFNNYGVFYFTKNKLHYTKVTNETINKQIIDSKTRNTFVYEAVLVDNGKIINNSETKTRNTAICQSGTNNLKLFNFEEEISYNSLAKAMLGEGCQTGILLTSGDTVLYKSQYSSTINVQRGSDSVVDSIMLFYQK